MYLDTTDTLIGDGWDEVELEDDVDTCNDMNGDDKSCAESDGAAGAESSDRVRPQMQDQDEVQSSFHVGSGFLIGRLSRFLDPTIPSQMNGKDDVETQESNGWKDESFDLGEDDLDDTNKPNCDDALSLLQTCSEEISASTESIVFQNIQSTELELAETRGEIRPETPKSFLEDQHLSTTSFKRVSTAALELAESGESLQMMTDNNCVAQDHSSYESMTTYRPDNNKHILVNNHQQYPNASNQTNDLDVHDGLLITHSNHAQDRIKELEHQLLISEKRAEMLQLDLDSTSHRNELEKQMFQQKIDELNQRVLDYQQKVEIFENQIGNTRNEPMQDTMLKLQNMLDRTMVENHDLRAAIEAFQGSNWDPKYQLAQYDPTSIHQLNQRIIELEENTKKLNDEKTELTNQLTNLISEKETLTLNLRDVNIQVKTGIHQLGHREIVIASLQGDLNRLNHDIVRLNQQVHELEQHIKKLECEEIEWNNKVSHLVAEKERLSVSLQHSITERGNFNEQLHEKNALVSALHDNEHRLNYQIAQLTQQVTKLEDHVKIMECDKTEIVTKVAAEKDLELLHTQYEINALRDQLLERDRAVALLQDDDIRMNNRIAQLNQQIINLEESSKVIMDREKTDWINKITHLVAENEALNLTLQNSNVLADTMSQQIRQKDDIISSLQDDIHALKDVIARQSLTVEEFEQQTKELNYEKTEMNNKLVYLVTENETISSSLQGAVLEVETLKKKLFEEDTTQSSLRCDANRMINEIIQLNRKICELEQQVTKRKGELEESNEEKEVIDLVTEYDSVSSMKKALDTEFRAVESEMNRLMPSELDLDVLSTSLLDAQAQVHTLKECLCKREELITSLEAETHYLDSKIMHLNERICESEVARNVLIDQNNFLEESKSLLQGKVESLSKRIKNLEDENEEILVQLGYFATTNPQIFKFTEKFANALNNWNNEKASLLSEIQTKNEAITHLEHRLANAENIEFEYHQLTKKFDDLVQGFGFNCSTGTATADSYQAIVDVLQNINEKLQIQQSNITDLERALQSAQNETSLVKDELNSARLMIESLTEKTHESDKGLRNQNDYYNESDVEYVRDLESMLRSKNDENGLLLTRLNEATELISFLKSDFENYRNSKNSIIDDLTASARSKEKDVEALSIENAELEQKLTSSNIFVVMEDNSIEQDDLGKLKEIFRKTSVTGGLDTSSLFKDTDQLLFLKEEVIRLSGALAQAEMKRAKAHEDLRSERIAYCLRLKTISDSLKQLHVSFL